MAVNEEEEAVGVRESERRGGGSESQAASSQIEPQLCVEWCQSI